MITDECGELIVSFGNAIETATISLKKGTYDINNIMTAINSVKAGCNRSDEYIKSNALLICCAERLCAVCTSCFKVLSNAKDISDDAKSYCHKCIYTAVNVLECCRRIVCDYNRQGFETDTSAAELDKLLCVTRFVRLRIVQRHRRIFSALAELEIIDDSCEILMRCKRLIDSCVRFSDCACRHVKENIPLR